MSSRPRGPEEDITATYEEYDLGDDRIALIGDPENEHAWIQSDVVEPIER